LRTAVLTLTLLLVGSGIACAQVAMFDFEKSEHGFTRVDGAGTVERVTESPLAGVASLKLTVSDNAPNFQVVSPEFTVEPWMIYGLTWQRRAGRGAYPDLQVELKQGDRWINTRPVEEGSVFVWGTTPGSETARIRLIVRVPGPAIDRSVTVDDIVVREHRPIVKESGPNLYWDGSFELGAAAPPAGWSFWVKQPDKTELVGENPRTGKRCFRITGDGPYPVLPSVPMKPYRFYRLTFWVRGKGVIHPGMHKLAPKDWDSMRIDTSIRVAWAGASVDTVQLKQDEWQQVEYLTPCESDRVVWFQPYFVLRGEYVDVDDVEMKSLTE